MNEINETEEAGTSTLDKVLLSINRHIVFGAATGVLSAVVTSSVIFFFLNEGIQSTRTLISENGDRIGRVETRIQQSISLQSIAIDRIRDDVDAVRLFLATSDGDASELSLDPNTREYPFDRLGMGGPGAEPVDGFFTFAKKLPFDAQGDRIEAEKNELSAILRRALIADNRFSFDDTEHVIEVYENYYFSEETADPRLELVAIAVHQSDKTND